MVTSTEIKIPGKPCFTCKSTKYWRFKDKDFVNCVVCHPPAVEDDVIIFEIQDPKEIKPTVNEEIEKLRQRIAAGVEKLVGVHIQIASLPEDEYGEAWNKLFESVDKLRFLGEQLEALGFDSCLFEKEPYPALWGTRRGCGAWPGGHFCWVCPMPSSSFWDKKIATGGSSKSKYVVSAMQRERNIEFLRTLGELI